MNSRNRRNNHLLTYHGKTQCLIDWANELNIKRSTLWARLCLYGWSQEKALATPVKKGKMDDKKNRKTKLAEKNPGRYDADWS